MKRYIIGMVIFIAATIGLSGCLSTLSKMGTNIAVATGTMSASQAESVNKVAEATEKTFQDITPEQEYYIGRSVAACILKQYKPYDNKAANQYLNMLGQTLATASEKPETFGGYHFLIMDTDEINAFAAPGGLIVVSRGLIRCCKNEDTLAAVLAHEIGHVQYAHGLKAISKSRFTSLGTVIGAEAIKTFGPEQLAEITKAFEGTISDITSTMVNSGYARKFETQADAAAVKIMTGIGYNPTGLKQMLLEMDRRMKPGGAGFAKTHPDPKVRIKDIESLIRDAGAISTPAARQARFEKALAGV